MSGPVFTRDEFDPVWYLKTYPDVRASGIDPWKHYIKNGLKEGRLGAAVRALELDHILWRGFEEMALPELRLLLRHGTPRERAISGWVLARHAGTKRHWKTALAAIRVFLASELGPQIVPHKGPWVLAIKAATLCGDLVFARELLARAAERFGDHPDFVLARLELAIAEGEQDHALSNHLKLIYAKNDLAEIKISPGAGSRFDRLSALLNPLPILDGPLVSVIVPAYCAEKTLSTCLRGLRDQSWRNLEIIVVDDASSDRTTEVAQNAAASDPRIRVIRQPKNGGAYLARNTGLAAAQGAFFTVHDADDWSHPQKIEEQIRPLLEDNTLIASTSHWVRVEPNLSMALWRVDEGWVYRNVSSLMVRMSVREAIGYWDRVRVNADTEYYHRLIAVFGKEALVEQRPGVPLAFGRTLPTSLTQSMSAHISTQFRGPRRAYLDAALYWQSMQIAKLNTGAGVREKAAALHLPQYPKRRPFPAPDEIRPEDAISIPSDYATIAGSPHFDALWYLGSNTDVLTSDVDPVRHYLEAGYREDRDPSPKFSGSSWRRWRGLKRDEVPLLDRERFPEETQPPSFAGSLSALGRPYALVFAHSADRQIFGAERSLLRALERLAEGVNGPALAPIVVLPSAVNTQYVSEVQKRAVRVEVLPQQWRHRFRAVSHETVNAIRRMIRRYDPLEVHVNTLVLNAPLIAAEAEGRQSIVHVRELPDEDPALCRLLGDSPKGLRRRILKEADRFIANSPAVAEWLDCQERVSIQLNDVDPELFDLPFSPGPALRIAMVSSNLAKKGIADFIEVSRLVADEETKARIALSKRCRFLLVGPDSEDLAALRPLPDNVVHAGYSDGPVEAIAQADIVLILSHFAESFGRTAIEAMAAGRPVVCYDRGMPPRLIDQGKTGFAVLPDDPSAVARAVLALSVARLQLLDMSRKARLRSRCLADAIEM